jgi:acetyl/propionyl-CoA carboxylase alpha subunit
VLGWAALLQVRINGEDPAKDFQPCPGILGEVVFPTHLDGVRVDRWERLGTAEAAGSVTLCSCDSCALHRSSLT